jgi:pilus assembly protein Flp/PilA
MVVWWGKVGVKLMRSTLNCLNRLQSDEDGAALVEYTVLLGILLVAVIATIAAVGAWVNNKWTELNANLALSP